MIIGNASSSLAMIRKYAAEQMVGGCALIDVGTQGWARATQEGQDSCLRVLAMREEDLSQALLRFEHFAERGKIVLIQNVRVNLVVLPLILT